MLKWAESKCCSVISSQFDHVNAQWSALPEQTLTQLKRTYITIFLPEFLVFITQQVAAS